MKNTLCILVAASFTVLSCTKESPSDTKQEATIPASEFEALKQAVQTLKGQVAALTPGEQAPGVGIDEFNALKEENEALKAQVATLLSTFFEVDGLRFDKNGDVISVPRIEATYEKQTNTGKLKMTRSFDEQGRLIETYGQYSGYNSVQTPPYYWQRVAYQYNGKTVTKNIETSSYSYGIDTHKESTETTYW